MKAIFNFREIDTLKPVFFPNNRAFCYGDGLFETIVTGPGRIDLIHFHYDRLIRGAHALDLKLPEELTIDYLRDSIEQLVKTNKIEGNVRTKLTVWRKSGGLYTPEEQEAEFYLDCKVSTKPFYSYSGEITISEKYYNTNSAYSFAKTTNALQYVLAGNEMKKKGCDEIILLDTKGSLSETHIGNLVWIVEGQFYTPQTSTGCIDGIMLKAFVSACKRTGRTIQLVSVDPKILDQASSIMSLNSSGIRSFEAYGQNKLSDPIKTLEPIIKQLLLP